MKITPVFTTQKSILTSQNILLILKMFIPQKQSNRFQEKNIIPWKTRMII